MFILQNPFVSTSCHFCFILRHFQENDVKPIHFKWCAHKTSAFHFNCSLKHLKICTKTRKFVKQFWLLALHAVGNSSQASPPLPQPPVTQPHTLISKLSQSSRNRSLNTLGKSSQLNPHTPPLHFFPSYDLHLTNICPRLVAKKYYYTPCVTSFCYKFFYQKWFKVMVPIKTCLSFRPKIIISLNNPKNHIKDENWSIM